MTNAVRRVTLLVLVFIFAAAGRAEAQYLDPGAGSVMIQALVAGLVGAATVLRLYWGKISGLFRRRDKVD